MNSKNAAEGNILLVANWESNVGYAWWLMENFWLIIANYFEKKGRQCFLIYPKITRLPASIASSDIQVQELDFADRSANNQARLRHFIHSNGIRHIYLSDYPAYSLLYAELRIWGIKRIVVHDHTPGDRSLPSVGRCALKSIIQRLPWVTADHFIAVSDFVYQRFLEIYCIPKKKCSVATNGIRPIDLKNIDRRYAHREMGIPEMRQIVVTTGRASYYKGIDFIIRCLDELLHNRNIRDLHFLYCGDGPDLDAFRELANALNVTDYITFTGKRTDINKILPSCDIGFHASKGEVGYSLSILEYMSAGLATIVPDRPSTSNAVKQGENGLVFHPNSVSSACDRLQQCRSPSYRESISKRAIISVREYYNLEKTNADLIQILDRQFSVP